MVVQTTTTVATISYPGGDYKAFPYPDGAVVIDNPPFSILASICTFYLEHGIPFFLFAPSLTCFGGRKVFKQIYLM